MMESVDIIFEYFSYMASFIFVFAGLAFMWALAICFITQMFSLVAFWITKKNGIIDVFWGLGISIAILFGDYRADTILTTIVFAMVLIWAIRLSGFIFITRILTPHDDRRYQRMIKKSPTMLMLKQIVIQCPLQALMTLTVFPLSRATGWFGPLEPSIFIIIFSLTMYTFGLIGECIADYQLHTFKKSSSGICRVGLWKYSRHPNYFFEFIIWCSISVLFIGSPLFFVSLLGPLTIFIILFFITGPITERCSVARHGDAYRNYQATTSYFFLRNIKS